MMIKPGVKCRVIQLIAGLENHTGYQYYLGKTVTILKPNVSDLDYWHIKEDPGYYFHVTELKIVGPRNKPGERV